MSDAARQTLARIVTQYGPSVADDPRRCEGLLRDLCGDARREINVLVAALKEKVVGDLQAGGDLPPEALIGRGVKKLQDNAGIAEDLARWAVESWALALGVLAPETLSMLTQRTEPSRTAAPHPKAWFYSHNGEPQQGPFSAADLRRMAAAGQLLRTDHLWKEGMPGWVAASSVKNLFPDAAPPSTPMNVQATPPSPTPAHVQSTAPPASWPLPQASDPASSPGPTTADRKAAREALKTPAILLLIVGVLGAVCGLFGFCGIFMMAATPGPDGSGPPVGIALIYLPMAIMNAVIAVSALQMMNLRRYPLALTASVLALIPCTGCFLIGLPVGIWSIVLLNKPEIKSAFQ